MDAGQLTPKRPKKQERPAFVGARRREASYLAPNVANYSSVTIRDKRH